MFYTHLTAVPDSILVNGKFTGELAYHAVRQGTVLVRIINSAAFSMYKISVDGVPLIVTSLDGNDIHPYTVPELVLNVGQRVNVLLNFSSLLYCSQLQNAPSIYFRVHAMPDMYGVDLSTYVYPPELPFYHAPNYKHFTDTTYKGTSAALHCPAPLFLLLLLLT
jgi:FtsP/CotA-like multicopper oxidase with cupredoxin domain